MNSGLSSLGEQRLKQVLVMDKQINPSLIAVLKSDVLETLKNYMDITADELNVAVDMGADGYYDLRIDAKVRRLISFSRIPQ